MKPNDELIAIFLPEPIAKRLVEGAKVLGMTLPEFVQALLDFYVAEMQSALDYLEEDWSSTGFIEWMVEQVGESCLKPDEIEAMARRQAELMRMSAAPTGKTFIALDHVEIRTNTAICNHCRTVLALPLRKCAATYEAEMREFAERHAACKPRDFKDTDCKGR